MTSLPLIGRVSLNKVLAVGLTLMTLAAAAFLVMVSGLVGDVGLVPVAVALFLVGAVASPLVGIAGEHTALPMALVQLAAVLGALLCFLGLCRPWRPGAALLVAPAQGAV